MSFQYYTLESININRKAYIQLKHMHECFVHISKTIQPSVLKVLYVTSYHGSWKTSSSCKEEH